jgi:hypothetical protein
MSIESQSPGGVRESSRRGCDPSLGERRIAPRARFHRDAILHLASADSASLEVVGLTPRGSGMRVRTTSVSISGAGLECDRPLVDGADVVLEITAPDGTKLRAHGCLTNVRSAPDGTFAAGINFYDEQPLLSALRVDLSTFGA